MRDQFKELYQDLAICGLAHWKAQSHTEGVLAQLPVDLLASFFSCSLNRINSLLLFSFHIYHCFLL